MRRVNFLFYLNSSQISVGKIRIISGESVASSRGLAYCFWRGMSIINIKKCSGI